MTIGTVTEDVADALGLESAKGAIVNSVTPNSPAEKSGLQRGDIILAVNGHEVRDTTALQFRIATTPLGDVVPLRIWRQGVMRALKLKVEAPPELPARNQKEMAGRHPLTGAVVVNMSPALGDELGIDPFKRGVMILQIRRGSPADKVGLRPGDFIKKVNGAEVGVVNDLVSVFAEPSASWEITIERQGRELSERFEG